MLFLTPGPPTIIQRPVFGVFPLNLQTGPQTQLQAIYFSLVFFFVTLHDQTSTEGKKVQNSFSTAIMLCDQQLCLIFGEELSIPLEFFLKKKKGDILLFPLFFTLHQIPQQLLLHSLQESVS